MAPLEESFTRDSCMHLGSAQSQQGEQEGRKGGAGEGEGGGESGLLTKCVL